jgi:23S rRNA pseudouridine1911/1915/1917 synthase
MQDRGDGLRGSSEQSPNIKIRRSKKGAPAITHIKVEKRFSGSSLIICRLETGKTNQIRIHLSEDGHPLVGETVYMRNFKGKRVVAPRLMLHAGSLGFVHPATGKELFFRQPLPSDFWEKGF